MDETPIKFLTTILLGMNFCILFRRCDNGCATRDVRKNSYKGAFDLKNNKAILGILPSETHLLVRSPSAYKLEYAN